MKRIVLTVLLALALPIAASAKVEPLFNNNGTLTASASGLSLQSTLTQIYFGYKGSDLGTLTITTGALISGSLLGGGAFSFVGSSYVATVNPGVLKSLPQGGVLFSGAFTAPISWIALGGGYYELYGLVAGNWAGGLHGTGYTSQIYVGSFNSNGVFTATLGGGQSWINPEPSTFALFITGLTGIAGLARRKLKI